MGALKFRTQLIIGFSIIILLSIISSIISVVELESIKKDTELLVKHPFTVSNAVKDIKINITAIHRTMKDVALSKTEAEFLKETELVSYYDSIIHESFLVVNKRFLGDHIIVLGTFKLYNQWEDIRNEVIQNKLKGFDDLAVEITKTKGDIHVRKLLKSTDQLIDFALNKADEFHTSVYNKSTKMINFIIIFMLALILVSILISYVVSRSILNPIHHFIHQIAHVFQSKQLIKFDKGIIMNEKNLLDYTIRELKSAHKLISDQNEELNTFNEQLEVEVAYKTKELLAQNEEYLALNEEYQAQNEQLVNTNSKLEISKWLFSETEKMGKVGGWEFNIDSQKKNWTEEAYNIHEVSPSFSPTIENVLKFYKKDSQDKIHESFDKAIKLGKSFDIELELNTYRGNNKSIHVIGKADIHNRRVYGFFQDITERKKADVALKKIETRLKDALVTKNKFFSIISHDLRSPFNTLFGFSKLLVENYDKYSDEKRKMFIRNINDTIKSTFDLLEDLLLWSKSQVGSMEFNFENQNLLEIVQNVVAINMLKSETKKIKIIVDVDPDIEVKVDKNTIESVLRNLLSNALKFSYPGDEILIKGSKYKNYNEPEIIKLCVIDHGVGITEDLIDDIFKLDKSSSTKGTDNEIGTGLGLILCKEFIEKNNGLIGVNSVPGKITEFWFTLPNMDQEIEDQTHTEPENLKEELKNSVTKEIKTVTNILIVDDESVNCQLLEALLTDRLNFKFNILFAKNGKEAVQLCEGNSKVNLVLMDVNMPIMNGYEATKRIKSFSSKIPIIIQTASSAIDVEKQIDYAGFDDFITKPIDEDDMINKIYKYLN